jgi:hypothetical protein
MPSHKLAVLASFFFITTVQGDTILQVTGPVVGQGYAGDPNSFGYNALDVVSWNQAAEYDNVDISFPATGLTSAGGPANAGGIAYLTTMMGPGTTTADQIATTTFTASATGSIISLFSGLNLSPNTYYLLIYADPGTQIGWDETNSPVRTFGTGVSLNFPVADGESSEVVGAYAPYLPDSALLFGFQVDMLVDITAAPEPHPLMPLLACSLLAFYFAYRRSKGEQKSR